MYVIVGGTGHVGSVVTKTLLDEGEAVTVVTRNPDKVGAWRQQGAKVALADVHDVTSLREGVPTREAGLPAEPER
ncbi:NAD(P)H-binding protein [Rhizobium sp. CCGE532]|uniref:NAD(P)H-binding protein n=1 Tax=unclassified Rhizobium TaxID=2613769 RepID=UPI0026C9E017